MLATILKPMPDIVGGVAKLENQEKFEKREPVKFLAKVV